MSIIILHHEAALTGFHPFPAMLSDHIARVARTCRSGGRPTSVVDAHHFVRGLLKLGHHTPLEFVHLEFYLQTSRAVAMELLRHRIASYMMESQRAVDYIAELPIVLQEDLIGITSNFVVDVAETAHETYRRMLEAGARKEDARQVLPECTATHLYVAMNLREFRHFLALRTAPAAWSEMRELAEAMRQAFLMAVPTAEAYLVDVSGDAGNAE